MLNHGGCLSQSWRTLSSIIIDTNGRPAVQTLLRGVVPDSFPSLLSAAPAQPGERRLVAIDDNVYRLYGKQIHQVRHPWRPSAVPTMLDPCLSMSCCMRLQPPVPIHIMQGPQKVYGVLSEQCWPCGMLDAAPLYCGAACESCCGLCSTSA